MDFVYICFIIVYYHFLAIKNGGYIIKVQESH